VRGNVMCFETNAGLVDAEIVAENLVKVWMPDLRDLREGFVNSGVPHRVVEVENLASADVEGEGRRIRMSDEFAPEGTNVDFAVFRKPDRVSIRTYERGVEAETGAFGTGSVAAAVIGLAQHGLSFPVHVKTVKGYDLTVDGEYSGGRFRSITLAGPVKKVYEGVIDWDALDIIQE
jgi:diaminopimelate epimerase